MTDKRKHSKEENQWLIDNIANYYSYDEMVVDYNKLFNRNYKNGRNLAKYCKVYLGISKPNPHLFGINCKKEEKYEIGEVVKRSTGYYIKLGKDDFREYGKYLYEQKYGNIPNEDFVIHLDGDKFNNDLNNLYHIPKHLTVSMARMDLYGKGKLTIAGAKYCELINKIRCLE